MLEFLSHSLPTRLMLLTLGALLVSVPTATRAQNELASKAQAILNKSCKKCHGPERSSGDLDITERSSLLDISREPPAVVPGNPGMSLLLQRVASDEKPMPPKGRGDRLSKEDIQTLSAWIQQGAPEANKQVNKEVAVAVATGTDNPTVRVQQILREKCARCHSGPNASARLQIMDHASLTDPKGDIVVPKHPAKSELVLRIQSTDRSLVMPPPDSPIQLTSEEKALIELWVQSGAPEFDPYISTDPKNLGRDYVLEHILKDVRAMRIAAQQDLMFQRYVSFNHLAATGITKAEMKDHVDSFILAINHLTWSKNLVKNIKAIDPLETVYRIDIRELGWHEQPFKDSSVNLYDMILLEYPYGYFSKTQIFQDVCSEYLLSGPNRKPIQVRPIPYIHGDWFIHAALRAPLYEDLLKLPLTEQKLEAKLGVDAKKNIATGQVVRAGMSISGVSRNNRIVERHTASLNGVYYWKSYDYANSRNTQNIFHNPVDLKAAGSEMVFDLPNGMQGYYISNDQGQRLTEAPTEIVTDAWSVDRVVRNGISCIRCHVHGIKPFRDNISTSLKQLRMNPVFQIEEARRMYDRDRMKPLVEKDTKQYLDALVQILGPNVSPEILKTVTYRFVDSDISGKEALAELGMADPENNLNVFRARKLAELGIAQLADNGMIRRDAWEDVYGQTIREIGQGTSVIPINSLKALDFRGENAPEIEFKTDAKNNLFRAKETFKVQIKNNSNVPIFVDVISTNDDGGEVLHTSGLEIPAGESRAADGEANGTPGTYRFTVLASKSKLPTPKLLELAVPQNGMQHMTQRVVHPVYALQADGSIEEQFDPDTTLRQSITIQTLVPVR